MKWINSERFIIFPSVILLLFSICGCEVKIQENNVQRMDYPPEIDTLEMREIVDDAKWLLYCLQYDRPLLLETSNDYPDFPKFRDYTLGMIDLQFCKFIITKHTYRIQFLASSFYDTILTFYNYGDGIELEKINGKILSIGGRGGSWWSKVDSKEIMRIDPLTKNDTNRAFRVYEPITNELKNFITSNFNDLDVWFRHEAIRRGVISPFYAFESYPALSKLERAFGISDAYKNCIVDSPQVRFEY